MQLEKTTRDEGEIWVWTSSSPAHAWLRELWGRGTHTEFSRFISTSFGLSKCTLMATVSTQALSVLRGSSR